MSSASRSSQPAYRSTSEPTEIVDFAASRDGTQLIVRFADRPTLTLAAELLWRMCPSAQGKARRAQGGACLAPDGITIITVKPVGSYAINIGFSDGHARGIYPWSYLLHLAHLPGIDDFIMPAGAIAAEMPH